jgi:hypothetical protein
MDRMPGYLPPRPLTRRRANALLDFVRSRALAGDERAASFLDSLLAGCFDEPPPDDVRDSGIRLNPRPGTVRPSGEN